jgi:hypothetical protein
VIIGISRPIICLHRGMFLQTDEQWDAYYPPRQRSNVRFFITLRWTAVVMTRRGAIFSPMRIKRGDMCSHLGEHWWAWSLLGLGDLQFLWWPRGRGDLVCDGEWRPLLRLGDI